MSNPYYWLGLGGLAMIVFIVAYFAAAMKMFENGEVYSSTPEYDLENVKKKHSMLRIIIFAMTFVPFIILVMIITTLDMRASEETVESFSFVVRQVVAPYTVMAVTLFVTSIDGAHNLRARAFEEPYILTRYMIYPKLPVSAFLMAGVVCSFAGGIGGFVYSLYESNVTIRNGLDFPFSVLCFVLEIALVYLANYAIIGWYDRTPNDFLFDKVEYADYDKAAKRYYGIWRNRLILANVVAAAQLVLGGFVTLTNAGDELMGIRLLGLALLVIVFSYILIQSREFDAPVVVKGMVYPSEKKRKTLKWVVLTAIAVYAIGAIILL